VCLPLTCVREGHQENNSRARSTTTGACHRTALTVRTRRGGTSWNCLFFAFPSASTGARWDRSKGVLTCVLPRRMSGAQRRRARLYRPGKTERGAEMRPVMPNVIVEGRSTPCAGQGARPQRRLFADDRRICEGDIDAVLGAFQQNLVHVKVQHQAFGLIHCTVLLLRDPAFCTTSSREVWKPFQRLFQLHGSYNCSHLSY
jgi:hypothetical protein